MDTGIPHEAYNPFRERKNLEGSNTVLVLGILSLVLMGIIGLILASIAIAKAKDCIQIYEMDPDHYTEASYKNAKAGKVCAIVSLSITAAILLLVIVMVSMS